MAHFGDLCVSSGNKCFIGITDSFQNRSQNIVYGFKLLLGHVTKSGASNFFRNDIEILTKCFVINAADIGISIIFDFSIFCAEVFHFLSKCVTLQLKRISLIHQVSANDRIMLICNALIIPGKRVQIMIRFSHVEAFQNCRHRCSQGFRYITGFTALAKKSVQIAKSALNLVSHLSQLTTLYPFFGSFPLCFQFCDFFSGGIVFFHESYKLPAPSISVLSHLISVFRLSIILLAEFDKICFHGLEVNFLCLIVLGQLYKFILHDRNHAVGSGQFLSGLAVFRCQRIEFRFLLFPVFQQLLVRDQLLGKVGFLKAIHPVFQAVNGDFQFPLLILKFRQFLFIGGGFDLRLEFCHLCFSLCQLGTAVLILAQMLLFRSQFPLGNIDPVQNTPDRVVLFLTAEGIHFGLDRTGILTYNIHRSITQEVRLRVHPV